MPYYRKKPHTILAFHFISIEESLEDLVEFVGQSDLMYVNNNLVVIKSPISDCKLIDGDYLVRDIDGNLFKIDQHTFEDLYELEMA